MRNVFLTNLSLFLPAFLVEYSRSSIPNPDSDPAFACGIIADILDDQGFRLHPERGDRLELGVHIKNVWLYVCEMLIFHAQARQQVSAVARQGARAKLHHAAIMEAAARREMEKTVINPQESEDRK